MEEAMDSDSMLQVQTQERISAKKSSWVVIRFIAANAAVGVAVVVVTCGSFVCLPFLKPTAVQILSRLREVSVFLFFTTAIAIGIFRSPRESVDARKIAAWDQYPLASIFGEEVDSGAEYCISDVAEQHKQSTPSTHRNEKAKAESTVHFRNRFEDSKHSVSVRRIALAPSVAPSENSFSRREAERVANNEETTPTHRRNYSTSRDDGGRSVLSAGDLLQVETLAAQSKLDRKSSFSDHSISETGPDHQPDRQATPTSFIKGDSASEESESGATGIVKRPKKVNFSLDSRPKNETKPEAGKNDAASAAAASSQELIINKRQGTGDAVSPNGLNKQADMFIAKFKEQMRMQRLESIQRYIRRL